jgi:hypothetical protein
MKKLFLLGLVSLQLTANAQWTHVPECQSIEDISVGSATQVLGVAAGGRVWYHRSGCVGHVTVERLQQFPRR